MISPNRFSLVPALSFGLTLLYSSFAFAADKPAADSAKAAYPLTTCVVSGDPLVGNGMGEPIDYVYLQPGHPERLVRFCCKDCIADFQKDPAKYLKKIDEATAAKAKDSHAEHKH